MSPALPLIGLVGRKGAGKDAVADILVRKYGYRRQAFATALKREVAQAIVGAGAARYDTDLLDNLLRYIEEHKRDAVGTRADWTRQLLQAWGQMRRDLYDEWYWIKQVELGPGIVITDVRHANEAAVIEKAGGELWRVSRPTLPDDGDQHVTEQAQASIGCPVMIPNTGTLADLEMAVDVTLGTPDRLWLA